MSKQKKDLPSYLVPGYKLSRSPNCTCPPGLYCECGPDYRPRDAGALWSTANEIPG